MAVVGAGVTEGTVRLEVTLLGSNLARSLVDKRGWQSDRRTSCLSLEIVSLHMPLHQHPPTKMNTATHSRVALLGLASLAGEHNQALLVRLQSLHIQLLSLLAQIPPPVVNGNSQSAGLLSSNTGLLELSKSESTSLADLDVVSDGGRTDGRAEKLERTHTELGGLGGASLAAAEFAPGLVEPGAHAALPVLAEVVRVEDVVVGETHFKSVDGS